jgi:hypothetical protein
MHQRCLIAFEVAQQVADVSLEGKRRVKTLLRAA